MIRAPAAVAKSIKSAVVRHNTVFPCFAVFFQSAALGLEKRVVFVYGKRSFPGACFVILKMEPCCGNFLNIE